MNLQMLQFTKGSSDLKNLAARGKSFRQARFRGKANSLADLET